MRTKLLLEKLSDLASYITLDGDVDTGNLIEEAVKLIKKQQTQIKKLKQNNKPTVSTVEIPCKIGDDVYQVSTKYTPCSVYKATCNDGLCCGCEAICDSKPLDHLYFGKVNAIRITEGSCVEVRANWDDKYDTGYYILGKDVFLK